MAVVTRAPRGFLVSEGFKVPYLFSYWWRLIFSFVQCDECKLSARGIIVVAHLTL